MKLRAFVFLALLSICVAIPLHAQAAPPPTCPAGVNHCGSLSWTPPTVGGTATGYNVYRSTVTGGCSTVTATTCTKVGASTGATFLDSPLAANTTYFWVVTATNKSGESGPSAQGSGTTNDDTPGSPGTIVIVLH